ncbi:ATP synthase subunit I [Paraburkholderia sp. UYCP14C]|uniref:ATP synthase subunit I n=1 Tax=Paraburkholderia sp. UYCP14C TaxID=2511130 RepID=UPI00101F52D5|nr:ATP synthase subunit I [Paraburkholderia sp. UYCP14C]RZF27501.1 ATP synthase subunit I [Paraburkholderia sp. UYCP14C]
MTDPGTFHLTDTLALAATGLAIGLLAGAVHFATLRWNVGYFASGRVLRAFALQLARLGVTAALFVLLAKAGAFTLLGGIGGFLWARGVALGMRRAAS